MAPSSSSRFIYVSKHLALRQPLTQTLWPYIGPVLFDVVETRRAVRFALNHPPAGGNIGESRPQAVLVLVIDQEEKAAIIIAKRVDAQQFSKHQTLLKANRRGGVFGKILRPVAAASRSSSA